MAGAEPQAPESPLLARAMLAEALAWRGRKAEAVDMARAVLAGCAPDSEAGQLARTVLTADVAEYHWEMLNDQPRNIAYDAALRRAVRPGDRVLEIGSGAGLVAMMAARAGAAEVISCEIVAGMAATAAENVAANGLSDRVRIVGKHSRDLALGVDLPGPADLLVSELIHHDLVGDGLLEAHRDVIPRLLRPGGAVLPRYLSVMVALGETPPPRFPVSQVEGFDLSAVERLRPPTLCLEPGSPRIVLRSEPAALFRFDMARPESWPAPRGAATVQGAGGPANAIVQWIRIEMDGSGAPDSIYENRPGPGRRSHWGVNLTALSRSVALSAGRSFQIHGRYGANRLLVWSPLG
jgi:type III protein arginine methyltransferase